MNIYGNSLKNIRDLQANISLVPNAHYVTLYVMCIMLLSRIMYYSLSPFQYYASVKGSDVYQRAIKMLEENGDKVLGTTKP